MSAWFNDLVDGAFRIWENKRLKEQREKEKDNKCPCGKDKKDCQGYEKNASFYCPLINQG